jgi:hypothetical protein
VKKLGFRGVAVRFAGQFGQSVLTTSRRAALKTPLLALATCSVIGWRDRRSFVPVMLDKLPYAAKLQETKP